MAESSKGVEGAKSLESQPWYHGYMSRENAEKELRRDGQYLVRVSPKNKHAEELMPIVSFMKWGQPHHIAARKTRAGKWYLLDENLGFDTVFELIQEHQRNKYPVSRQSGAILTCAITKQNWHIEEHQLRLKKKLGSGVFGEVWLAGFKEKKGEKETNVAIKTCLGVEQKVLEEDYVLALQEAMLMLHYTHRNIVKLIGISSTTLPLKIVMEYCSQGSLLDHLIRNKKKGIIAGKKEKIRYSLQAARGMAYLASQQCIHRDLAARNCLLGDDGQVKIADFGMSRMTANRVYQQVGVTRVPLRWAAPESFTYGTFSEASDVFSFGVLMWEIFSDGAEPWGKLSNKEVMEKVKRGERLKIPPGVPSAAKQLIQKCWRRNPKQRNTFQEAVQKLA